MTPATTPMITDSDKEAGTLHAEPPRRFSAGAREAFKWQLLLGQVAFVLNSLLLRSLPMSVD